jgi:hypothetical protein
MGVIGALNMGSVGHDSFGLAGLADVAQDEIGYSSDHYERHSAHNAIGLQLLIAHSSFGIGAGLGLALNAGIALGGFLGGKCLSLSSGQFRLRGLRRLGCLLLALGLIRTLLW